MDARLTITAGWLAVALLGASYVVAQEADDPAEVLAAARRLAEQEPSRAMAAYRRLLTIEPGHQQAYAELLELADEHGVQRSAKLLESLAKEFPSGTHLRTSEHFLIVYDMPHTWADTRMRLLEQVRDAFYRQMTQADFQPWPLNEPLVCVLFNRHEDYLAYAQRIGTGPMENSGGFYAAGLNRVVFFSNRGNPQLRQQGRQLERVRRQVNQIEQQLAAAERGNNQPRIQNLRNRRVRAVRALAQIQNRYNTAIGRGDIVQTAHEAAHLLAFNSGVQIRGRAYPLWISEGLATAFETTNPAVRFGPGHDNPLRRRALVEAAADGLMPLRELIELQSRHDIREGQASAVYAQVWGLFHFLWNEQRDALRDHLRGIGSGRTSTTGDEAFVEAFEASFGDVAQVERRWHAWVRTLED